MNIKNISVGVAQKLCSTITVITMVLSSFAFVPYASANNGNGGGGNNPESGGGSGSPNPSANLDQAANGGNVGQNPISPVMWVNGDVNETKGHYQEGQSMPYRVVLDGLTPNALNTLVIELDVLKSNGQKKKFAIDYITSNNRISETVDPCVGVTGCTGSPSETYLIPAPNYTGSVNGYGAQDVLDSFNTLVALEGPQYMKIWNGDITNVAYTTSPNLSNVDSAQVTITFTATSPNAVISWGGHISESRDYPGESAVTISGSPYHTRLISFNGSGGNQDRALSAGAVEYPGNLIVIKNVVGGTKTASDFNITVNASTTVSDPTFPGDENGTIVDIEVPNNTEVPYAVSEAIDPDYTPTYSEACHGTITSLEQKVCTVTNTYNPAPKLTLVKDVKNDNGGVAKVTDWTLSAVGAAMTISGTSGASAVTSASVPAGTYTLSESGGPNGYAPSAWVCTGKTVQNNNEVTLAKGDNVTCTITNDDIAPKLTLIKKVDNDDGGTAVATDWTVKADGSVTDLSGAGTVSGTVNAGTYTLSESGGPVTDSNRYVPSAWECTGTGLVGDQLVLGSGDDVTCTITNTYVPPKKASITIFKTIDDVFNGGTTPASFTYYVTSATNVKTKVEHNTPTSFDAGTYTVSEDLGVYTNGYTQSTWGGDCVGGTVTVGEGESATCTITNTAIAPQITIIKRVENGTSKTPKQASDFQITLTAQDINGNEADDVKTFAGSEAGTQATFDAGTYEVAESNPGNYTVKYSEGCKGTATLGQKITCTVTNTYIEPTKAWVTFEKVMDSKYGGKAESTDFTFEVSNGTTVTPVTPGETIGLVGGTYTITEKGPKGYEATYSEFCAGGDFDITPNNYGKSYTCTVINHDIQPKLTVIKKVINNDSMENDVVLNASDFTLTVTGANVSDDAFVGDEKGVEVTLDVGEFLVEEKDSKNYDVSYSADCQGIVEVGDHKTCTVTNDDIPASEARITVKKIVKNDADANDGGNANPDDFAFSVNGGNPVRFGVSGENLLTVNSAGQYTITESEYPRYKATYNSCAWDVVLGYSYTCEITNTELPACSNGLNDDEEEDGLVDYPEDPGCSSNDDDDETDPRGSISIKKIVEGEGADKDQAFTFDLSWSDADGTVSENGGVVTYGNLTAGQYTIEELLPSSRWDMTGVTCWDTTNDEEEIIVDETGNKITVNLTGNQQEGDVEDVVCTFTNTYTPRDSGGNDEYIIVRKEVTSGSDASQVFTFNASWEGTPLSLAGGMQDTSEELAADETYRVSEGALPSGWSLVDTSCASSQNVEERIDSSKGFILNDGETVTCTFTNDQERYILDGHVWHDRNRNGSHDETEEFLGGWTVRATDGVVTLVTETDAQGFYSFNVPRGTWTVTQDERSGWSRTHPGEASYTVTFPQEEESENFFETALRMFVPIAYAGLVDEEHNLDFGNYQRGGGGGGGSTGTRVNRGDDDSEGEVLGAATSTLPVGAPNTGAGGSAPVESSRVCIVNFPVTHIRTRKVTHA
ncbi:MAG TPA: SdrD B-like domain-containing protein [Candidatus Paceibacterota bacterium]|nr:SdrD B-like domain-containing protein [Candidatus Paceibacterota bacterium]